MSIKLLVVCSDVHCGSSVALLPPGFVTLEGQEVKQNALQQWLWECWRDVWDNWLPGIVGKDEWALVVNGDLTEGIHHGGKQVISGDVIDHQDAAKQILEPLAKRAAKTFIVAGTECHTANMEQKLAKSLGAVPDPNSGKAAWDRLDLTLNGVRHVIVHHISATVRPYLRGSMLSIYPACEQLSAANNAEPIPRVFGYAHRHGFDHYQNENLMSFVTAPWQGATRHVHKVVPAPRIKPGIVVIDARGKAKGELPELHSRHYAAPQPKGYSL